MRDTLPGAALPQVDYAPSQKGVVDTCFTPERPGDIRIATHNLRKSGLRNSKDLATTPDKIAETAKMVAGNAAHLAGLLQKILIPAEPEFSL
jgi:hypothetical protein